MNKPIRIVHVIYRLAMGGMENGLINLVNRMDNTYEHHIVSLTDATDFSARIEKDTVSIYTLNKKTGKDPAVYWRLWKVLRKIRPDIVHTRNFGTVDCAMVVRLAGAARIIHSEHGWDMNDVNGKNRKYLRLRKWMSWFADRCLSVSRHIEQWQKEQVGVAVDKLVQIYNGVDSDVFQPNQPQTRSPLVIGFVGRLEEVKNVPSLVRAIARLHGPGMAECPVKVQLIGSGSMEKFIREAIAAADLGDSIELLGAVSEIPTIMRGFDLFVLPSFNEGISNTILEAMATGLPIIAADVGGNRELVEHGINGMLYPSDDDAALARIIQDYARDAELRGRHGKASRQRVEEYFTIDKMVTAYADVYDSMMMTG